MSKPWTPRWSTAVFTGIGYAGDSDKDMFDQRVREKDKIERSENSDYFNAFQYW
ncbi:hypothetical protein [Vibrio splendidus]|uniref:hypothetical protein n=1 Tax=Vibrio splendidus TaxID=29497 RepID=UPI001F53818E|nr:hypothetical protein [Vibrio splendidus]